MAWLDIFYKILCALVLVLSIVLFFVKNTTSKTKTAKAIENTINAVVNFIDVLQTYMSEADAFKNYTADEKLQYVITRAMEYSNNNNIAFDKEELAQYIAKQCVFTKKVNYNNEIKGE